MILYSMEWRTRVASHIRDYIDQQNEAAGRETGRQRRFLPDEELSPEGRRKKAARERFTALMRMLADPAYRAHHEHVMQRLRAAELATDHALRKIERELIAATAEMDRIEDRAARLPDGSRVYRDAHGMVRRADGTVVEDDLVATILWRGGEPCFEGMRAAREQLAAIHHTRQSLIDYQNGTLGPARDRMQDEDSPPSLDEMRTIERRIRETIPSYAKAAMPERAPPAAAMMPASSIALPDLSGI